MTAKTITHLTANYENHGNARLIVDGRKVAVGSIHSYGIYCGKTPEQIIEAYDKATKLHHPKVWVNLCSLVICGDAGFYDREAAKWADVPHVSVGDCIEFEGQHYTIEPTFNRNYKLVPH